MPLPQRKREDGIDSSCRQSLQTCGAHWIGGGNPLREIVVNAPTQACGCDGKRPGVFRQLEGTGPGQNDSSCDDCCETGSNVKVDVFPKDGPGDNDGKNGFKVQQQGGAG